MDGAAPSWLMPLGGLPAIAAIGVGTHQRGEPGRWRMPGWCLHSYTYAADLTVDGVPIPIRPGCVGVLPPDSELRYVFRGPSTAVFAHFRLAPEAVPVIEVPAMQDLGRDFAAFHAAFMDAVAWYPSAPRRAEARLYDLLWQVAGRARRPAAQGAVDRARGFIEQRLASRLDVAAIARAAGCSPPHLLRLFRAELGSTVVGYVRTRRVSRARVLLISTTMPIAAIAREVGIADPHAFNKAVKRELGAPPKAVRARGGG